MTQNFQTVIELVKSRTKYVASFLKSHWGLDDYPIRIKHQKIEDSESGHRFVLIPWVVQIINWWTMSGHGNTKEEALSELRNKFEKFKAQNKLPRPGTKMPMQIEVAPSTEIDQYEHIAVNFFQKILNLDYYECLITDESSLWDFHGEETNDHLHKRISAVYEVDVSDIESGNLVEIFKRIVLLSNRY